MGTDDDVPDDYWIDLNEKSKFIIDKDTGENLAIIDDMGTEDNESDDQKLLLSRTATVKMMKEEGIDKKLEDLKQSELAELTEKYLESEYANPSDKIKEYSVVDNYIKELGNQGVSLKDLRMLGEADYTKINDILEGGEQNEKNRKLVEKYISEFLRADIITQQPHRTKDYDLVKIDDKKNYVDGGIYLWRSKEDTAFPDSDFDTAPKDDSVGGKDEDSNYVKMEYIPPAKFLQATGILAVKPFELTTEEEIQEFIREKGLKELLQGEGRASYEVLVDSNAAKSLIYCYTQDPDTDEILMIKYRKEQTITGTFDDPLENIGSMSNSSRANEKYIIQLVSMPYKDQIAKYIMPYEFLIDLCEITQNPEFVYHVALMARDTYIVLKVQDNEKITRDTTDTLTTRYNSGGNAISSSKSRTITITKDFNPTIRLRYANTWSWYEDFEYTKNWHITSLDPQGPTVSGGQNYTTETWKEHKAGYNDYFISATKDSVHKSQQFLGLLRNKEGKCKENCSEEIGLKDKQEPKALECVRNAEFYDEGINVQYTIPGTNIKEAPFNKLESGLDMLYALMQSNYSGYREWENILDTEENPDLIKEIFNKAKEFFEKGDEDLLDDKYDEGKQDYMNAYIVKLQGTLEHLRYLMTFPPNEGDLEATDPKPGSVYRNGVYVNGSVVCYLTSGGRTGTGMRAPGGSGDALWKNQISKQEFMDCLLRFDPSGLQADGMVRPVEEGWADCFANLAEMWYEIPVSYGINPMFIVAEASIESAWGNSNYAVNRHNLFGIGSYDGTEDRDTVWYNNYMECIENACKLTVAYMTPGTSHYEAITGAGYDPTSIIGIRSRWCTEIPEDNEKVHYQRMHMIFGDAAYATGTTTGGTTSSGGSVGVTPVAGGTDNPIIQAAADVTNTFLTRGGSYYSVDNPDYENDRRHPLNYGITVEELYNSVENFCCASYVHMVLWKCGALPNETIIHGCGTLEDTLINNGWVHIENPSQLQPGDVLVNMDHTMIYYGEPEMVVDQSTCIRRERRFTSHISG